MDKDDQIVFRVPRALKEALVAAAEADHRSLGQLCTFVLAKYLEDRGEWPPRSSARNRTRAERASRKRRSGRS